MFFCLMRLVLGGVVIVVFIGYFMLYSKKKLEVLVLDVVKVVIGVVIIDNIYFCK